LLAMSGGNLFFLTDVQVNSTSGTVSLVGTQPHPLSDVLTIQSLEAQSDYNLYYADALLSGKKQVATYNLGISSVANGIIYSGSWALTDNNSGTIYPALPIDFLYALYEAPGQNPTQAALTRSMLNDVARLKGIPPHILYGVAFQESSWQQFADGFTKISADGGIGLFQLTAATALNNTSALSRKSL
jgi:hypothetical protein